MIIIGYPGIGKSTLSKNDPMVIDLDSSLFKVSNKRVEGWEIIYCNIAERLSQQGYDVCVSSHPDVRKYLRNATQPVISIFPDESLKDEWTTRLKIRKTQTLTTKDELAYEHVKDHFDEDILSLKEEMYPHIIIIDMTYSLQEEINAFRTYIR